jgi:uncharacterized membrane protein YphA (DoxX/SURF4 family)
MYNIYIYMLPLFIPALLITLMFFTSGIEKIMVFTRSTTKFAKKMNISLTLAKVAMSGAIVLELLAPVIITGYNLTSLSLFSSFYTLALISLILFTIVVTALFHNPLKNRESYYAFMSNLSTIGGLLALYTYK